MTRGKLIAMCLVGVLATGIEGLAAPTSMGAQRVHDGFTYDTYESVWGGAFHVWRSCCDSLSFESSKGTKERTARLETPGTTFKAFTMEGVSCESAGAKEEGEVTTAPTTLELGYINKKKKEVGLEERPTSGNIYATFTCGEAAVELKGALIGRVTPVGKTIKEGSPLVDEVVINKETGKDKVTHFEGGAEATMEEQVNGTGFHEIAVEDSGTIKTENGTLEVKAAKSGVDFVLKWHKKK